uniref:Uncharacterized protein n=1 Tax=Timema bartmani TaxID=61472 RepID=A0A7R9EVE1_9NEOP|nr:unnamed protein product [Timema bartmani]
MRLTPYLALACLAVGILGEDAAEPKRPKMQITRTALHVGRSLNPELTETLSVKTKTGEVATLIVKKRDGKSNENVPSPVSIKSTPLRLVDEKDGFKRINKSGKSSDEFTPHVTVPVSGVFVKDNGETGWRAINVGGKILKSIRHSSSPSVNAHGSYDKPDRKDALREIRVPDPVYIRSSPMFVKGEQQESWKRQRSLMTIDSDGIPVITGVRMPDDESDRQVWRNARVINGILFPKEKTSPIVSEEVQKKEAVKPKLPFKDTSEDRFQPIHLIEPYRETTYKPLTSESQSRILEYINTVNQRETKRREEEMRGRNIHYPIPRFNQQSAATPSFIVEKQGLQARMLHYPGNTVYPTSLLYTPQRSKPSRVSFEEGVRTPVLQYAHPELGVQPAKVERKQDDVIEEDGNVGTNNDNKGVNKSDSLTMAYFSQDIHSDHSPYVFQPNPESHSEGEDNTSNYPSFYGKRSNNEETNSYQQWPQKTLDFLYQQQQEDSYGSGNEKYIKRYPYNGYNGEHHGKDSYNRYKSPALSKPNIHGGQGFYETIYATKVEERPFWERIGDSIKEHVQTSMEKVSDLTRPVMEPLVEASHKISHNLGYGGGPGSEGKTGMFQDKIGGAVAAYPVLLPALGLVAGGAALGLGAVAVGRFLDVDVMKRRSSIEEDEDLEMEHKRTIQSIVRNLEDQDKSEGRGEWIVAKVPASKEDQDFEKLAQQAKWMVSNRSQTKRSLNNDVIFVVEEDTPVPQNQQQEQVLVKRSGEGDAPSTEETNDRKIQEFEENVAKRFVPIVDYRSNEETIHRISKRSYDDRNVKESDLSGENTERFLNDILNGMDTGHNEALASMAKLGNPGDWSHTHCAKKIFCDAMILQSDDSIILMEKKMAKFLTL